MSRTAEVEKEKNPKASDAPGKPGIFSAVAEILGLVFRPLVPLTILIVVYAGISFLLWRPLNGESGAYESSVQALLTEKPLLSAFAANQRPVWVSFQDYKQVAYEGANAAENHSVFEAGLSRKLAAVYERNSWVERVREVRLRYPARVELELDFRKPYAKLDRGAVLDRQGFALNISADSAILKDLPVLTGIGQKIPVVGKQTAERPVFDALDLLAVARDALVKAPGSPRVRSIELNNGMWQLVTSHGTTVHWGTFSEDPPIDEPRTQEKTELLRRRLSETPPGMIEYVKLYVTGAPIRLRAPRAPQE